MSRKRIKLAVHSVIEGIRTSYFDEERVLIYGKIVVIQNLHNIVVDGRTPYQIVCEYVDHATMTIYHFTSEFLWYNPKSYLKSEEIPIYVDPTNFSLYEMDLISVLK